MAMLGCVARLSLSPFPPLAPSGVGTHMAHGSSAQHSLAWYLPLGGSGVKQARRAPLRAGVLAVRAGGGGGEHRGTAWMEKERAVFTALVWCSW